MLSRRPLVRAGDGELFVAHRRERDEIAAFLRDELNVLVAGNDGTGKTSLAAELDRAPDFHTYRVTLNPVKGIANAAEAIAEEIAGPIHVRQPSETDRFINDMFGKATAKPTERHRVNAAIARIARELEDDVDHHAQGRPIVVIVDALALHELMNLFTIYADQLAEPPCTWVVMTPNAGDATTDTATNPAAAFFDHVVILDRLTPETAQHVVASRLSRDLDATEVDLINLRSPLTVTDAVTVAREIAAADDSPTATSARLGRGSAVNTAVRAAEANAERRRIADLKLHELGRPAAMLAAEMKSREGVSPSDEEILAAMGWKRSRASEVMASLERAGLAVVTDQAGPNGGRPRRIYRLVDELR